MSPRQRAAKELFTAIEDLHNKPRPEMTEKEFKRFQHFIRVLTQNIQPRFAKYAGMYRKVEEVTRGDTIKHDTFGTGHIQQVFADGFADVVFRKEEHGKKRLALQLAIAKMRRLKQGKAARSKKAPPIAYPEGFAKEAAKS